MNACVTLGHASRRRKVGAGHAVSVVPTRPTAGMREGGHLMMTALVGRTEPIAAPTEDVRDVVFDLVRLNELPDAGLMAGQVIVVPAG